MLFHNYHRCICSSSRNVFINKIDYCRIYGIHRKRLTQHIQYCDNNINSNSSSYTRKIKAKSSFLYQYGIVREIDRRIQTDGITLNPDRLSLLDLNIAKSQHEILIKALRSLSIDIHTLSSHDFPDSVFIEDTTVIIDGIAVITKPGAATRAGETTEVRRYLLERFSDRLRVVDLPHGTLDGGDVLFTGKAILVGLSSRTNEQSINCLREIFPHYPVISVDLKALMNLAAIEYNSSRCNSSNNKTTHHQIEEMLHLKSFCSACGEGKIVVGGLIGQVFKQWLLDNKINYNMVGNLFKDDDIIHLPDAAAANCIYANEIIIRRSYEEYPDSVDIFLTNPYLKLISQLEVRSDELAKVDGALTCCSVLF